MNQHTTDSKTVYILLKDLPNINKGAELVWNGNEYTCPDNYLGTAKLNQRLVEGNPAWFEKKKLKEAEETKRIEVRNFRRFGGGNYGVTISHNIPEEKYDAVKRAIEQVLNNEVPDIPTLSRQESFGRFNCEGKVVPENKPKDNIQDMTEKEANDIIDNVLNQYKDAPKEEVKPLPKQMWNPISRQVHDERNDCNEHNCVEYNPLNKEHSLK